MLNQTVNAAGTTTTVTSSRNPSPYGTSVTFTAVVSSPAGTPTGYVTFRRGTTVMGWAYLNAGRATITTSTLPRGTWTTTATYTSVPANFGSSVGSVPQVVN